MKHLRFLPLLLVLISSAQGQWTRTSRGLLGTLSQNVGAMTFKDGVIWAGTNALWHSTDSGVTWTQSNLGADLGVAHIYFLDRLNGLVSCHNGQIFRTSDGGTTWNRIQTLTNANSAVFLETAQNIVATQFNYGTAYASRDGGQSWSSTGINNWVREALPVSGGKARLLAGDWGDGEHIWETTDYGMTWGKTVGMVDPDGYSFDQQGCGGQEALYIINEEYSYTAGYDGASEIFVSKDGGLTYSVVANHPAKYFAGSVAIGPNTAFCPTVSEANAGVLRTSDAGKTWKNIGGPSATGDTRLITAIDDNIIVAADIQGSIWVTTNSGGFPLALGAPGATALLLVPSPESILQYQCGQVDTIVPFYVQSCAQIASMIDSVSLTGSSSFHLSDPRTLPRSLGSYDSIAIRYSSSGSPNDTARLRVFMHLGNRAVDTTLLLVGSSKLAFGGGYTLQHPESRATSYGNQVTLPLTIDLSPRINLDSMLPTLQSLKLSVAYDQSVLSFVNIVPAAGWTISSLNYQNGITDVTLRNISAVASQPFTAGSMVFQSITSESRLSYISLTNLEFEDDQTTLPVCLASMEDHIWAVETRSSNEVRRSEPEDLGIFPNPSAGQLSFFNSSDDLVRVVICNVLGATVLKFDALPHTTARVDTHSLPSGSYIANCHIAGAEKSYRFVKF